MEVEENQPNRFQFLSDAAHYDSGWWRGLADGILVGIFFIVIVQIIAEKFSK